MTTKAQMIQDAMRASVAADIPILLWSPPGMGKTAFIEAEAAAQKAVLVTLIGSQLDPIDVGGYLVPDSHGNVKSSPPPWATRIREAIDTGRPAWLFMDEISCAPPSVQAALLRVVNERQVGGLSIKGCRVFGASNPEDSAADNGYLSQAMALRWMHVDFVPDYNEWARGELSGWGRKRTDRHVETSALLCTFIRRNPKALMPSEGDKSKQESRGGPCPRTWSNTARALASLNAASARDAILSPSGLTIATGLVGSGAAGELVTFATALDLRDPEDYLNGHKLPNRGDHQYAAMDAVVAAVISKPTADRVQSAWKVVGSGRADVALVPAKVLLDSFPDHPIPGECMELGDKLLKAGA